ncbi:endonuclease/exonuclease/phosphatase family protein [Mucilaginibacter gotjawali]|uniref:Endonuclease/exonuclease/phosphatase family metal-dependent hydrolase n=1 Tax=Mucilaginibacter gotjawali TaxID=1550579 RepID=A0A839SBP6_9SPHI|nr:endonuclease/exonuclease/phosphatase family protein [Mucilaginibacter gotjawali]MBB3054693.1 endonuclease/exonuclease/phosphatase family metal-dependent hydrolase [Mucilaginibacter gotjawali]
MKADNKLPFIDRLFLWINIILCVALLLSYLAPFTDPRKILFPAFLGLAYPLLLLLNVLMIFYWLIRKKWHGLISVITILAGYPTLLNNIGFHGGNKEVIIPKPANTIRIMTYNVHHFRHYGSKMDESTRTEILQIVKQQQPDILGFQEYFTQKKGVYDFTDSIMKILNVNFAYFKSFTISPHKTIGMAIFSRYPITDEQVIPLSDSTNENQCLYIDVLKDNKPFRYYNVHLKSIGFDPEDYKYLDGVSKKGKTDIRSTKRMGSKLVNAFKKRAAQMYLVKENSRQCPYPYIISGDFNDTPSSFSLNQMAAGLKNAFREKGSGFVRTYNGDFPNFQIDYILTSQQFNIVDYQVIEKKLSDHYPVRSDVFLSR